MNLFKIVNFIQICQHFLYQHTPVEFLIFLQFQWTLLWNHQTFFFIFTNIFYMPEQFFNFLNTIQNHKHFGNLGTICQNHEHFQICEFVKNCKKIQNWQNFLDSCNSDLHEKYFSSSCFQKKSAWHFLNSWTFSYSKKFSILANHFSNWLIFLKFAVCLSILWMVF